MAKGTISFSKILLQAALAAILVIAGLSVFMDGKSDEMVRAVGGIFNNSDIRNLVVYLLAIIELVAGALLILDFFHIVAFDKLDDVALLVVIIVWCVFMLLADVFPLFHGNIHFLNWLAVLAQHALVLSSMLIVKEKI